MLLLLSLPRVLPLMTQLRLPAPPCAMGWDDLLDGCPEPLVSFGHGPRMRAGAIC